MKATGDAELEQWAAQRYLAPLEAALKRVVRVEVAHVASAARTARRPKTTPPAAPDPNPPPRLSSAVGPRHAGVTRRVNTEFTHRKQVRNSLSIGFRLMNGSSMNSPRVSGRGSRQRVGPCDAAALTLPLAVTLAACGGGQSGAGGSGGIITVDGSSTVYPITEAVAEEFRRETKGAIAVTVGVSGTGGGFQKFCRGETDFSDASRPIHQSEIDGCAGGRRRRSSSCRSPTTASPSW